MPRYPAAQSTILAALVTAADAGDPCPSNEAIAAAVGFGAVAAVRYHLNQLEAAGTVRIEARGRNRRRAHFPAGRATAWNTRKSNRVS